MRWRVSEAFGFGGLAVALLSPFLLAASPQFAGGAQEDDSGRTRVVLFRVEVGESERVLQWELELDEKGIPTSDPI